jgi:hypothetical protein
MLNEKKMVTRKVVIASSVTNAAKKLNTAATTLGELKAEAPELFRGDVEIVVKPGNVTLRDDGSELPSGDFKVYVIPTKNKAGNITVEDAKKLGEEIAKAIVDAASKSSPDDVNELKDLLVEDIESFFGVDLGGTDDVEDDEAAEALAEARSLATRG